MLYHLILTITLWGREYSCFTEKKIKVQRSEVTCPSSYASSRSNFIWPQVQRFPWTPCCESYKGDEWDTCPNNVTQSRMQSVLWGVVLVVSEQWNDLPPIKSRVISKAGLYSLSLLSFFLRVCVCFKLIYPNQAASQPALSPVQIIYTLLARASGLSEW